MQGDNKIEQLFILSLLNELNEEEQGFVLELVNTDPKYKLLYEELKETVDLTVFKVNDHKIDLKKEWKKLETAIATHHGKEIGAFELQPNNKTEQSSGSGNKKASIYRLLIASAVAASVLIMLAVLFDLNKVEMPGILVATNNPHKKQESITYVVRREINTSAKARQILLMDGSEIMLERHSEISFEEPFRNNRRDIVLKGKAVFNVAKDKNRPFSVISGDIKTTALGTSFMVSAFHYSDNIQVQLYEGKVVISAADSLLRKLNENFYLLPGQEFIYRIKDAQAIVRLINRNNPVRKENKEVLASEDPSIPKREKSTWYMFNNQPVGSVFQQLAEMYQSEIVFQKNDVSKIYFIGKFDKSDSLENILKEITKVNNLKLTRKNNKFFITK